LHEGEWKFSSSHSEPQLCIEVSDQLLSPANFAPRNSPR